MGLKSKFKNMSPTVKATIAFGVAQFAISGINYITTPIFTRLITTSDYGVIAVYNSWYSIIQVFATMTLIYPGILHVGLYEHSENRWKYLSSMLGVISTCTAVLAIIYVVFHVKISNLIKLNTSLMVLMLLVCIFQSATTLWTTKQRYEYNYRITITVTIGSAIFAQIVSIIAVLLLRNDANVSLAEVRLWSAGLINITVGIILYAYIVYKGRTVVDFPLWKATFLVALPLIPHYLSSVVLHSTDKIMISQMVGDDMAGIYSLASTLASIGILFWRALSTTFSPFVNTKLGERKFRDINECVLPLLNIVAITCFLGALAAPEIIRILATEEYLTGIYVIPPMVIGIFLHAMYEVFAAVAFFHKKSGRIMMASLVSASANIVLNYFCIQKFGFIAAGYTTFISNLILTAMHYFNMRRIENERIYNVRYVFVSIILVSALCLSCNWLYQTSDIVRYLLIAITVGILISQRRVTVQTINKMKV